MSLATRTTATIRSVRALHTSAWIFNEANTSSSLGFGDYSGRTRKLPTIPISASSQRNLIKSRPTKTDTSPVSGAGEEQDRGRGFGAGKRHPNASLGQGQQRKKRQDRSPIQASLNKSRQSGSSNGSEVNVNVEGEGGDFFGEHGSGSIPTRHRGSNLKKVNLDLSAVTIPSSSRTNNKKSRSPRSSVDTNKAVKISAPKVKAQPVAEVEDRSAVGIFGRMSLLFPVRRGAREAERSVWADGMKPDQARKAEMERLAGSASIYLPSKPFPTQLTGKNAHQASKTLGDWLLATNPGISMRRAKTGAAVIKGYLK